MSAEPAALWPKRKPVSDDDVFGREPLRPSTNSSALIAAMSRVERQRLDVVDTQCPDQVHPTVDLRTVWWGATSGRRTSNGLDQM